MKAHIPTVLLTAGLLGLVPPEGFEPIWCECCVARRILDIAMAEVSLQRSGVMAVIRQLVAAGVPQHVHVNL